MDVVVSKWGNSSGIRIPGIIMRTLHILEGDHLFLDVTDDTIILKKKKTTKEMFEEFYGKAFEQISDEDIGPGEVIDWGEDVGGEIIS